MKPISNIGELRPFDVVRVPFPFTEQNISKTRPAVVLSSHEAFGHIVEQSVMCMVTSATRSAFPLDVPITDFKTAGLPKHSIIRLKLFTLHHQLVLDKVGLLSKKDQKNLADALRKLMPLCP